MHKKSLQNNLYGIPHIHIKGSSLILWKFYKSNLKLYQQQNSLLLEAFHISSIASSGNEVALYHLQSIKLTVGAKGEPLHTSLKDIFGNLLFSCIWKDI